jgi:hypothetical protein
MLSRIKEAPLSFDGTIEELYSGWAKHVLLAPSIVEEFHIGAQAMAGNR